jgi:hypothetical protein
MMGFFGILILELLVPVPGLPVVPVVIPVVSPPPGLSSPLGAISMIEREERVELGEIPLDEL